jgi:3',5'-cyclic AMP phosphodiesterase CpdA
MHRRDFLKLAGIGIVFVSGLGRLAYGAEKAASKKMPGDFYFVQMSDPHWGFNNPKINPDFAGTLEKAIVLVNGLEIQPDFIIFTGDLTHDTDDDQERRKRLGEFKNIVTDLKVKNVKFMPGEHDAAVDNGKAFMEVIGKTHYTFNHKGVNFITLDNVSDPGGSLGDQQLRWLGDQLKKLDKEKSRIVVLCHRPLFVLYDEWEWETRDGAKAIDLLMPYKNVTVFYGHIHQENHHMTGHIAHHSAHGLMYPLPAPGSQPKLAPLPWDPAQPYKNLGFRSIEAKMPPAEYGVTEYPLQKA